MTLKELIITKNMYESIIRLWKPHMASKYIQCTDEFFGYEVLIMPEEFTSNYEYFTRIFTPSNPNNVVDIVIHTDVSESDMKRILKETRSRFLEMHSIKNNDITNDNVLSQNNLTNPEFVSKKELIKQIKYFTSGLSYDDIDIVCNAINKFNGTVTIDTDEKRILNIFALLDAFNENTYTFQSLTLKQVSFLKYAFSFSKDSLMEEIEKELTWLENKMKNEEIKIVKI